MASEQRIVDYITDQIGFSENVTSKKKFAEFSLYFDTKLFGFGCSRSGCSQSGCSQSGCSQSKALNFLFSSHSTKNYD
jgi:hypothetical protein